MIITGAAGGIGSATVAELRSGRDRRRARPQAARRDVPLRPGLGGRGGRRGDRAARRPRRPDQQRGRSATRRARALPPDEEALAVLDVNLIGPWRVTSAALPALRESRGRVVNVASGLAHITVPFATAYTMSKRGVVAYSDALRLEHGDAITVTTVYPGYIRTRIHEQSARPASRSRVRPGRGGHRCGPHAHPRRARRTGPRPRHDPPGHAELRGRARAAAPGARRAHPPPDEAPRAQGPFRPDGLAGEFAARLRG